MNMDYPELPKRFAVWRDDDDDAGAWSQPNRDMFTADQMRAYVDADRAQRAAPPLNLEFEEALSLYWGLAFKEGSTGESHGTQAQEVLSTLQALFAQRAAPGVQPGVYLIKERTDTEHELHKVFDGVRWYFGAAGVSGALQSAELGVASGEFDSIGPRTSPLHAEVLTEAQSARLSAIAIQAHVQPPQQSAQPVADGCVFFVDPEIIRWTLAGSPRAKTQLWLAKTARPEDGLTMPLYAAAQPVGVQRVGLVDALDKLSAITAGITEIACESADGWWETSTGEEFGAGKLREIENLIHSIYGIKHHQQ